MENPHKKTAFFPYRFIQKTRIIMVSIEEEDEEEELTTTEAMSEKMCEELEAMQSLTHEEIVEKILAVTKKNNDGILGPIRRPR